MVSRSALNALPVGELEDALIEMREEQAPEIPRIRIEHSPSGRHRMFKDLGESYLEDKEGSDGIQGNKLSGIVVMASHVRALFQEDDIVPTCASNGDIPVVDEPIASSCRDCGEAKRGGRCKPKVKLLLLTPEQELVAFPLSPTSIKHWNRYVRKLGRSKLPYIAVLTRFSLQDVQRNGYRWAEVVPELERLVTVSELTLVREIRDEAKSVGSSVEELDFRDAGDRAQPRPAA